jgi:hypothetical protein
MRTLASRRVEGGRGAAPGKTARAVADKLKTRL